jgi:hypothetical protein
MDGKQFDLITKSLYVGISRRGSLGVLAAGLASVVGTALGWRGAGAQEALEFTGPFVAAEDNDPTCRDKPSINNRRCPRSNCTRDPGCFCAKDTNNDKRCVKIRRNTRCPRRDQCDRNKDCLRGQACIKIGGCCRGRRRNLCLPLCA